MTAPDLAPEGIERKKFYHADHDLTELLKARNGEFLTDEGEAWRYEYSHTDGLKGRYDMLFRIPDRSTPAPTDNAALLEAAQETCQNCQGNGEIITDWDTYMKGSDDDRSTAECPDCSGTGCATAALSSRAAAPTPAPVVEPVAWRFRDEFEGWRLSDDKAWMDYRQSKVSCEVQPLYAHPPAAADLTTPPEDTK